MRSPPIDRIVYRSIHIKNVKGKSGESITHTCMAITATTCKTGDDSMSKMSTIIYKNHSTFLKQMQVLCRHDSYGALSLCKEKTSTRKWRFLCLRYLFSRPVTRQLSSAYMCLTSVFGMGTGGPT